MVSDPNILEQIYISNFSQFSQGFTVNSDDPIDTSNILLQSGDDWKRARSTLATLFTASKLRSMTLMMNTCLNKLNQVLDYHATNGRDFYGEAVFSVSLIDFVTKCLFGIDIDVYSKENETFVKRAKGIFDGAKAWNLLLLQNLPSWLLRWLGTTFSNTQSAAYFQDVVKQTIEQRTTADSHRQDMILKRRRARRKQRRENVSN